MSGTPSRLTRAIRLARAGRTDEAAGQLHAVLAAEPEQPDVLYLAGILAGLEGHPAGEGLIARAAAADPRIAWFDAALGRACREQAGYRRLAGLYGADLALRRACRLPDGGPRRLAGVTLCCIDTAYHDFALVALKNCLGQCRFDRVLFLSDEALRPPGMTVAPVGPIPSAEAYSRFVLKDLPAHVDSPHVLIAQWDGFIRDARHWSDEFLGFDYIGARWTCFPDDHVVGNGGFSLRSQALLKAVQDPHIEQIHPEDFHIGRTYRPYLEQRYGIRIADPATADRFSVEQLAEPGKRANPVAAFGFHNLFRMYEVLEGGYLDLFLDLLPPSAVLSNSMTLLAVSYFRLGEREEACRIARRMLAGAPSGESREVLRGMLQRAGHDPDRPDPDQDDPGQDDPGQKDPSRPEEEGTP